LQLFREPVGLLYSRCNLCFGHRTIAIVDPDRLFDRQPTLRRRDLDNRLRRILHGLLVGLKRLAGLVDAIASQERVV